MSDIFQVSIDLWKISCRMGANSLCNVCWTMGLNLSGPAALCGFKHTNSMSMPPADMLISGIFGWKLGSPLVGWPQRRDITHITCAFCRVGGSNDLPLLRLTLL